ncbi:MAG: PH domain-containing protein [Planctomycetaceae bacterium]|nr:PH domain-containing protein [Planctomycetaceae bacterium]
MTVFPSVASLALGRGLGALYESVPIRIGRLKLSHLLFPLPTSPLAFVLYFGLKAIGARYVLTTQRLRVTQRINGRVVAEVPLDEIGRIDIATSFGQRFYHAGTLFVRDHVGTERLRLVGVVRPDMFRQTILEARDALIRTDAALRTIEGRHVRDAGAA